MPRSVSKFHCHDDRGREISLEEAWSVLSQKEDAAGRMMATAAYEVAMTRDGTVGREACRFIGTSIPFE
jgi:hypothetical protein